MSDASTTRTAVVPDWTLGWRLQRALDFAGVKAGDMAEELEVTRSTISRWMNDHGTPPRTIYVRQWAAVCGVPFEWLMYGEYQGTTSQYLGESVGGCDRDLSLSAA